MNKKIIAAAVGLVMMTGAAALSIVMGTASPSPGKYPVFGVDVSNYHGSVDWSRLAEQGVRFAFIKATEGSSHVDESVENNLTGIAETDVRHSCYHFFSFDSPGETQADNFIRTVDPSAINMPPVVDIEYYADKRQNKPTRQEAEAILRPLLERLEEHYGTKPIIYTTLPVYLRYVRGSFGDYPLWIRCTQAEPDVLDWDFWQYSDSGRLDGYSGDEPCIDFNVYCGSEEDFYQKYETF